MARSIVPYGSPNCFIQLALLFHMARPIVSYGSPNCFIQFALWQHVYLRYWVSRMKPLGEPYTDTHFEVFLLILDTLVIRRQSVMRQRRGNVAARSVSAFTAGSDQSEATRSSLHHMKEFGEPYERVG